MGSRRFWKGAGRLEAGSVHCSVPVPEAKVFRLSCPWCPPSVGQEARGEHVWDALLCFRMPGWVPVSFLHVDHARGWRLEETLGVSK